ncbi:unnamed protein product [Candidula unifasciata]|uniref:ATP-binding cassette sub-family B member 6 n=1 Tax=Candidula unifasciata TaxID=100452 RepID=A0A8S3YFU2_9EUPU|nr:unnamed protein product [Candidula unifasciata]
MEFCENGTSWSDIWVDDGFNRCFYDAVSAIILFGFIFISGFIQCLVFSKYAVPAEQQGKLRWVSKVQVFLIIILILEALLHMVLSDVVINEQTLYGYQVMQACAVIAACIVAWWLLAMEKRSMLPSFSTRGQGFVSILFWMIFFVRENVMFVSWSSPAWWWQVKNDSDRAELGLFIVRYIAVFFLLALSFLRPIQSPYSSLPSTDEEPSNPAEQGKSTWSNSFTKVRMMLPYVWPKTSFILQFVVGICLVLLVVGRVINVFVPIYSKNIVNSLTYDPNVENQQLEFKWNYILIYVALLFLKGGTGTAGFVNNLRSLLWIRVEQYCTRSIQLRLFTHLHNLSLRWHIGKKTGEMLRVVDRGTASVTTLLSYILFQILPTIADIVIAIIYFVTAFNYLFGIITFLSMAMYLAATVKATEWRTKYRRQRNVRDNAANARAVDTLLNFETVKYYAATDYEREHYEKAILEYQLSEWKFNAVFNVLSLFQNIINTVSLIAGSMLCAWAVVHGIGGLKLNVGDYVLFGTYTSQLYGPLNTLGNTYRMIQQAFIDMENMFELLETEIEVKDVPGAKDLVVKGGAIEFENVSFQYEPNKPILKDVSFSVPAGHTFALVGHTGSGKSTIVRLLFRFYDVNSGCIKIDGQDIAKVTQKSLRSVIGVVPQDTVLFNNDIRYNIRYGRLDATDEEVEDAAKAAEIHERILTFPKKYDTVVGERGLRLSGGEKQRVAIARTLLKAPAIVLLDEATSALDTRTERSIQSSLARVCENRTTIIVAHRLSTIIHAHQILVLQDGEILESGTHSELLEKGGTYADMWQQQLVKQGEGENDKEEKKEKPQRRNLSFNNQNIGSGPAGNGSLQSVGRDDVLFQV